MPIWNRGRRGNLPPFCFGSAAPDAVAGHVTLRGGIQEVMARLAAEMRQVDCGHAVGGADLQDLARRHRQKPLARAQHGQRAQKAFAIDLDIETCGHGWVIAQG